MLDVRALTEVPAASGDVAPSCAERRVPAVMRGLAASWPALGAWSLDALAARHGGVEVVTARASGRQVVTDARHGLEQERRPLGAFLAAMAGGAVDACLMSPIGDLPPAFAAEIAWPGWCARAPFRRSKLWIAPAGMVSPMHRDIADNLHVQVTGRKRFTLAAPSQSDHLYPNGPLHGFPNGCGADVEHPDFTRFPRLRGVELSVVELAPGDAVYMPRLWWHHVRTLEASVSVNLWWARGAWRVVAEGTDLFKRARRIGR
jgi:hypothetical protein